MRRYTPDFLIIGLLFLLPLILFWQQTAGGRTLLPTENLYQYEPYATYRAEVGAPAVPHNHLVSDLILQNYQWKSFLRQSIDSREIPLWNPHQFSGIPFLAAGQQSALYPLSLIYYVLPLTVAYGWFTVINLWLAGVFMLLFLRGLGFSRMGGTVSAVTYQLCGFFVASAVFPMIVGTAVWLPLILLMTEFIIQQRPLLARPTRIPWVVIGAGAIGFSVFAGHVEMTIYTLLITGYYAAARIGWSAYQDYRSDERGPLADHLYAGLWLSAMILLGLGLSFIQLVPLYQVAQSNWRAERSDLGTVLGYAHPARDVIQFLMPNFYGSPAHHTIFDIFKMKSVDVDFINALGEQRYHTEWGIKNYVEGALYLGILPLMLAAYAVITSIFDRSRRVLVIIFALLGLVSLTFMFGLPTYATIYFLPGINQLNSPFRWIYGVTIAVSVLAGIGAHTLFLGTRPGASAQQKMPLRFGYALMFVGGLTLVGLIGSRVLYDQVAPLVERIFNGMAKANEGFPDAKAFYSYQFRNAAIFGVMTFLSGGIFWASNRKPVGARLWLALSPLQVCTIILIAADLMIASWGFNPASDPDLLDFTPPSIAWLKEQQVAGDIFRYTTLENAGTHAPLFQPNMTMSFGLDDVRGYDSIISSQYVDYMRETSLQNQLDFNRIAPLYMDRLDEIDWGRLGLLNVRYLILHSSAELPENLTTTADPRRFSPTFQQVYEDEAVRIYRNANGIPRISLALPPDDAMMSGTALEFSLDPYAITLLYDTGREKEIAVDMYGTFTFWLMISETYAPGWRAFIRPAGVGAGDEQGLEVNRVLQAFQGVRLNPNELAERFTDLAASSEDGLIQSSLDAGQYIIRMVYSPTSFQVGGFGSVISAALLAFLVGLWVWRMLIGGSETSDSSVSRVARNSVVPILLNLFNRGIDFTFALVMLRILGPEDAGIYYYAVVVFVWFDIFTNFGLDVFIIREVSRQRERARFYLFNSSAFRLMLMVACVPMLVGFLILRQATVEPELSQTALVTIALLYIGLAPASLNKGLTSLFYAFEKAEYPAAVTTITTINRVTLQLIALLLGYGIVGLAGTSIIINLMTLGILAYSSRELWSGRGETSAHPEVANEQKGEPVSRPYRVDGGLFHKMRREGWPLMLNHFLATIFFQIDVVILETIKGAVIVGQYSVAYRWLLALNVIPAFFTQALLPVMSRQAREDRAALKRTYTLGIKLLVAVALPLAVAFTFLAETLTLILGGAEYLPVGAIALQIMIWSIPIGWINSLTQYALIAVDLQRKITGAFAVAVTFNIISNAILIPQYSYQAAAITTIFSEMVLLIPFGVLMQSALGKLDWAGMVWKPAASAALMFAVCGVLWSGLSVLSIFVGGGVYVVVLLVLRPLNGEELAMLSPVLPGRIRRLVRIQG